MSRLSTKQRRARKRGRVRGPWLVLRAMKDMRRFIEVFVKVPEG